MRGCLLLVVLIANQAMAQSRAHVAGRVIDALTNQAIITADVTLTLTSNGSTFHALTNDDGKFELKGVPLGVYVVQTRRLGYAVRGDTVQVRGDKTNITVKLNVDPLAV